MLFLRAYMATNVEVEKNSNESSANVIRRFTKRMQGAGIVPKVRGGRYFTRIKSGNVRRTAKLKKLDKAEAYEKLVKLGVVQEHRGRGRR
jgi:ribosomal protein S21